MQKLQASNPVTEFWMSVAVQVCCRVRSQIGPGSDGRVFGLDVNEDMLALTRRICPDIDWHQGDAGELPFDDTSFDAVVSQ